MPQGDKSAYTDKQKRKAEHIEEGYEKRGVSEKEAERRAWATVNKDDGGGNKSGSGRGTHTGNPAAHKGGEKVERPRPAARPPRAPPPPKRPPPPASAMKSTTPIRAFSAKVATAFAVRKRDHSKL